MLKRICIFTAFFLVFFIFLNLKIMQVYEVRDYPVEIAASFDEYIRTDFRDQISKEKPEVVAIGDSSIRELDQDVFNRIFGKKTSIFSTPGSGSAYWYLFLRNEVLSSSNRPRVILFFFRSVSLTTPSYLVSGSYYTKLEEVATSADTDVYALSIKDTKGPLMTFFEKYIPLFAYRSQINQNMVKEIRDFLPGIVSQCDSACVDGAFDKVFDDLQINAFLWEELVRNLDSSLNNLENYDFQEHVDASLVPLMLRDCRNQGIIPIFIRVKTRAHAQGISDVPELQNYLADLKKYINQNGGIFVDLVDVDALTADMYRDSMHINAEDAPFASSLIAEDIKSHLEFLFR